MSRPRLAVLLLLIPILVALAGCPRTPAGPTLDRATLAKGQHLSRPFTQPGRCFGKPSRCVSDGQCAPPFSLCQEGTCCSGQIDPVTCECRCGNGPACGPRELCCDLPAGSPGSSDSPITTELASPADTKRGLQCRPVRECFAD
jgi:hypothetical protein